ncbi:MAG: N-acyl-D-amino-acid deacylase family protein [Promethearchaeota archaeon]
MNEILIKQGTIIDGTGARSYKADVLIRGDLIAKIGNLENLSISKKIKAEGLVVSPGFMDVHSHLGFLMASPRHSKLLENWTRQGVTTIVSGNCGYSPAPINPEMLPDLEKYWYFAFPKEGLQFNWKTMEDFFNYLEKKGISHNLAMLTGHNTLRANVMGFENRSPSKREMDEMKEMLEEAIRAGSIGLSLGLDYVPGIFSKTEELMELASVLTPFQAPLVPHARGFLGNLFTQGMREIIEIAEKNKIPLHISHHAGGGVSRARKIISEEIIEAIQRGVKISHDNIPFPNASTTVLNLFPPWAFSGGMKEFFNRLKDANIREQIKKEMSSFTPKWPPWEYKWWTHRGFNKNLFIFGLTKKENHRLNHKKLFEIADILNKDPADALIDLVLSEDGKIFYISGQFDSPLGEDYVKTIISDPNCSIGTDIVGLDFNTISPVINGAFTKIVGNYVREEKLFSLEEAVRKITSLPASQMQIENRGVIKEGFHADITIFDPATISCTASYKNPHVPPEGIEHVIINGQIIYEQGIYYNNVLAGKVLRKNYSFS